MVKQGLKIVEALRIEETLAPLISSEKGRYVGLSVLAIAAVLVLYSVVSMCIDWHADYKLSRQPLTVANATNFSAETSQIDSIPAQHIFGSAAVEDTDFLPVTSAQLHLTGIIQNSDGSASKIIISEAGQSGKVYRLGDEVISGITINAINDDSVVLEHQGRFEKLPLVRARISFKELPQSLWQSGTG